MHSDFSQPDTCWARESICPYCNNKGHIEKACRIKKRDLENQNGQAQFLEGTLGSVTVTLNTANKRDREVLALEPMETIHITLNPKGTTTEFPIEILPDTGANVTAIPDHVVGDLN